MALERARESSQNDLSRFSFSGRKELGEGESPRERIQRLADLRSQAAKNPLGVEYVLGRDGSSAIVIASPVSSDIVVLPTKATHEEFRAMVASALPLRETRYILAELARAYRNNWPILLEGGTAIGKTYAVNLFCKLLEGPKAEIVDFYCNGQTDVSEMMGKFVPGNLKESQMKAIDAFLATDAGAALKEELRAEGQGTYTTQELVARAAHRLQIHLSDKSFRWQDGSIVRAMKLGLKVHVQEVSMAPVPITNALLKFRGDNGCIARSVQLTENDGALVQAQNGFFMIFSTNPAGREYERHVIDPALVRALYVIRLPDRLSTESIIEASRDLFSRSRLPEPSDSTILNLRYHEELAMTLGSLVGRLFLQYREKLLTPEAGRRQRVTATLDHLSRVATLVQTSQVPKADESGVDFVETVRGAVYGCLIAQLEDKESLFGPSMSVDGAVRETKSLGRAIMDGLSNLLKGDLVPYTFRGRASSYLEAIQILEREAVALYESGAETGTSAAAVERARAVQLTRSIAEKLRNFNLPPASYEDLERVVLEKVYPEDGELVKQELEKLSGQDKTS